jgi:hypothetical protein
MEQVNIKPPIKRIYHYGKGDGRIREYLQYLGRLVKNAER